jgi:DNA polymerase-3 subunit alpha
MSLLDIVSEEEKEELEVRLPNVGEYDKAELLSYEKEVLGFYISGHPLEEYQALWERNITAKTSDFVYDEETGNAAVKDKERVTVGGIITEKKITYTKRNDMMAFITLEDLVGSVEVIVFPKVYQQYSAVLEEENKVFIEGRISLEEERDGKLLCEKITLFDKLPRNLWIKFPNMKSYVDKEFTLLEATRGHEGIDKITIYIEETRQKKVLAPSKNVKADSELIEKLCGIFGKDNVKLV